MSSDPAPTRFEAVANASGLTTARVSVSITAMRAVVAFTDARCPRCRSLLMVIPRRVVVEVRIVEERQGSGRGRVLMCHKPRCGHRCEVIEHG